MTGAAMENKPLFSEIRPMYISSADTPNVMNFRLRMKDPIDGKVLQQAVDTTMRRYPYFCVRLTQKGRDWFFEKNDRPVVVIHSESGVELNAEASHDHLLAVSWYEDWILIYMSHALTDGTGAYHFMKTLLYYYCSAFYQVDPKCPGVWLVTDEIDPEEWEDPCLSIKDVPPAEGGEAVPALNVMPAAPVSGNAGKTVTEIAISESEFMRFNSQNEGSPATMMALLLGRTFSGLFPDAAESIRVSLCVNLRKATQTPLAHQALVGGIWLEYAEQIRDWSLEKQMTVIRGKLMAEMRKKKLMAQVHHNIRQTNEILALETDSERAAASLEILETVKDLQTATVSYVGKAEFGELEQYVEEFHTWAPAMYENVLLEVTAINHQFFIDFIQNFEDDRFVRAFVSELGKNGIEYQLLGTHALQLPGIHLPWCR